MKYFFIFRPQKDTAKVAYNFKIVLSPVTSNISNNYLNIHIYSEFKYDLPNMFYDNKTIQSAMIFLTFACRNRLFN